MIIDVLISAAAFMLPSALLVFIKRKLQRSKGPLLKNAAAYLYSFVAVNWVLILAFRHWLNAFQDEPFTSLMNDKSAAARYFLAATALAAFLPSAEHFIKYIVLNKLRGVYGKIGLSALPPEKKTGAKHIAKTAAEHLAVLVLLMMTFGYQWMRSNFFHISMYDIIFTLSMPLKGMSNESICTFINRAVIPVLFFWGTEIYSVRRLTSAYRIVKKGRVTKAAGRERVLFPVKFRYIAPLLIAWFLAIFITADNNLDIRGYVRDMSQESEFIENEYIWPSDVSITFPAEKRNLIYIYVESAETTLQDKASGGLYDRNVIPGMTELARENLNFSDTQLTGGARTMPGCTNTMEGITAQSAGIPMKLGNHMEQFRYFMPKVTTLGDILEAEGYHNYFMCGSELSFAGRDKFFTQHGDFECFDYTSAVSEGKIDEDYKVWWGFEDRKLYQYAKEKITMLASSGRPFNFTMLTVDTHNNDGYICEMCGDEFDSQYYNVFACASAQLCDFVSWIKEQDFYEDTVIIISGDHLSMDRNGFTSFDYNDRRVYNCFINSVAEPVNAKNRSFCTLDMFPTTLAALGADIEGDRLGLGTNLFSDRQTLTEEYGYEYVSDQLKMHSDYYNDVLIR